jgi:hypothetical protein
VAEDESTKMGLRHLRHPGVHGRHDSPLGGPWAVLLVRGPGRWGDASQRTQALADGVSLSIQSLEYGSVAALMNLAALLVLTWKYHWSKAKKTPPQL